MNALFLANLAATFAMVGLIWLVQLVHYPLFAEVGPESFARYHLSHTRQVTWIVAPVMGLELVTSAMLLVARPEHVPAPALWLGLALVLIAWGSTALLQVPLHSRLAEGFDPRAIGALVATNWVRTAVWTTRGALVLWIAWRIA